MANQSGFELKVSSDSFSGIIKYCLENLVKSSVYWHVRLTNISSSRLGFSLLFFILLVLF